MRALQTLPSSCGSFCLRLRTTLHSEGRPRCANVLAALNTQRLEPPPTSSSVVLSPTFLGATRRRRSELSADVITDVHREENRLLPRCTLLRAVPSLTDSHLTHPAPAAPTRTAHALRTPAPRTTPKIDTRRPRRMGLYTLCMPGGTPARHYVYAASCLFACFTRDCLLTNLLWSLHSLRSLSPVSCL